MTVSEHNIITMSYEVREGGPGGRMVEQMSSHYPFKFLFGTGKLLPGFEAAIAGLSERDSFAFTLPPQEAYGFVEQGNIVDIPKSVFDESPDLAGQTLSEGQFVALTDDLGETHNGTVLSWDADHVKVDFNHALAGKTLYFRGVILTIRKATIDELVRGTYIQEGGVRR
ncbi:MAG: FKBP-type peptidyl-prolyl cis-trans isomerase [Bacteroidota bacterium]